MTIKQLLNISLNIFQIEDYPVMMDLYEELKTMRDDADKNNNSIEKEKLNECIAFIRPLAKGADAIIFNGHTKR